MPVITSAHSECDTSVPLDLKFGSRSLKSPSGGRHRCLRRGLSSLLEVRPSGRSAVGVTLPFAGGGQGRRVWFAASCAPQPRARLTWSVHVTARLGSAVRSSAWQLILFRKDDTPPPPFVCIHWLWKAGLLAPLSCLCWVSSSSPFLFAR